MFGNYFKIAWRNIRKNKTFSIINILGLALGMACSLFIFLWAEDERGIDSFHENGDQLYIVTSQEQTGDILTGSYDTPGLLADELKLKIPEIELACNYSWSHWLTFSANEKIIKQKGFFAGVDFFNMFSYPLLLGTKETALKSPESIALSEKMATKLFGSPENAMDKLIRFENSLDLQVTAVFEDLQKNVSENFEYIINWELFIKRNQWVKDWGNSGPATYVMLKKETNQIAVESKIKSFIAQYDKDYSETDKLELGLQKYDETYLNSKFKNGYISGGRIEYVNLFSWVAIFILLIACINFMNLSTARSIKRAKEIGVRKVIGATRSELIKQFLAEAFLFTILAVFISLAILFVLLPVFNNLTNKQILFPANNAYFGFGILILTFFTGLISGSYPAFLLSSFKPISVLQNKVKLNSGVFRKGLVVFQFVLSLLFIVGMMIISEQVNYIQTKHLGYQKDNLIYLSISGKLKSNFEVFKNKVMEIPGISDISNVSQRPVEIENTTSSVHWEGKEPSSKINFTQVAIGHNFVKTMQAEMVEGRDFSKDFSDAKNYIVNETALKIIGYKNPIGKPLTFWGTEGVIVGVIKDFHIHSLHVPIAPLIIRMTEPQHIGAALIRIESGKTQVALEGLEKLHQQLNPDFPFSHQFADEEYAMLYESEQVVQKLSGYFAFLAIFISCLGLFGLVTFMAEQRFKEIGIRKVLGSSVLQIVALLSKDFIKLVLISFLIAFPLGYYFMDNWLQGFAYRINIHWSVFVIAGLITVLIAFVTISFRSIKAANANPIESLKTE